MTSDTQKTGVYFAERDHAGLLKRILIIAIDLFVLVALGYGVGFVCRALYADELLAGERHCLAVALIVPLYLVGLKRHSGTVGYWLTGVRIVDLRGQRPGVLRTLFRLLLWWAGPFNVVYDLFWLSGDASRQTLRDKWAGTYVVRKGAAPSGEGAIAYVNYCLLGFNMVFPEVRRSAGPAASGRESEPG